MANLSSAIANWQKRQADLQAQQVDTEKVLHLSNLCLLGPVVALL